MKRYSTYDLIIIAIIAAIGLGTKQIIRPLVSLVSFPLGIPGGAIVGGFYMLWLVLTKRLVPKFGSGLLFGLTQALVVMILPFGSHGIFTLITYTLPGLGVDFIDLAFGRNANSVVCSMIEGALANFIGSLLVLILIFRLELEPTIFITLIALLTGNIGGIISYFIARELASTLSLEPEMNKKNKDKKKELPVETPQINQ
ncbi:MAG: ECF transporter S component [Candidatus Heimdallarchaeota archaeon]|nr:ECF transporter S component [Candidatus Heimdallarchaeota archaeon]